MQAEHGIKSLSTILTKHFTDLGQMWPKYLPIATLTYNTFNTPNLVNYSPYEVVVSRKPKLHFTTYKSVKDFIQKVAIKYIAPLVAYKIIDPHNYLLMTLDCKICRGLFEHERIKQL